MHNRRLLVRSRGRGRLLLHIWWVSVGLLGWIHCLNVLLLTEMRLAVRCLDGRKRTRRVVRLSGLGKVVDATSSIEAQELDLV